MKMEKEEWSGLVGKRILLGRSSRYRCIIGVTEATVLEVSGSGKYVKFKWASSGSETWEEPADEFSFKYQGIVEVLGEK